MTNFYEHPKAEILYFCADVIATSSLTPQPPIDVEEDKEGSSELPYAPF